MSNTTFECKFVITRKPHRCVFCWWPIPIGEKAYFWKGVFDGDFQQNYGHAECAESYDGEDFTPGDWPVPERIKQQFSEEEGGEPAP